MFQDDPASPAIKTEHHKAREFSIPKRLRWGGGGGGGKGGGGWGNFKKNPEGGKNFFLGGGA